MGNRAEVDKTPNPRIDAAINKMMGQVEKPTPGQEIPPDTAVKIITAAIAWEKVKHSIKERDGGFDPDDL